MHVATDEEGGEHILLIFAAELSGNRTDVETGAI